MAILFSTLKAEVQRNLGNRTDADTALIILNAYNATLKMLVKSNDWPELTQIVSKAFTVGDWDIDITAAAGWNIQDLSKEYSLVVNDGTKLLPPLQYVVNSVWDTQHATAIHTASGKPAVYTWGKKNLLYVSPAPDATYAINIRYRKNPTLATADASVIELEDAYEVLVMGTTSFAWLALEQVQLASVWMKLASEAAGVFGIDMIQLSNFSASDKRLTTPIQPAYQDPFSRR